MLDPTYQHFKVSPDKELELTLDGVPIEYPALVKEAFLNNWHASAHRTDVPSNCASLNERHCWVMSRNQMFIWERAKSSNRATIPHVLPLPTSGLPRSSKCVVVYDGSRISTTSKLPIPGVVIVSPEGVLRHWTSIESSNYIEKVLDINSEVALKLELTDEPSDGKSASFLLTTTSGTIYFINGEGENSGKTGSLECHKVIGREPQGFRRRLSSIIFSSGNGLSKENPSLVTNSFTFESKNALLVVEVSPDLLSVFNMLEPSEVWTLKTKEFFQQKVTYFFEQDLKRVPNLVRSHLIDVSVFRGGLMCLVGGSHEDTPLVSLFIVWLSPDWQTKQPTEAVWSAKIPINEHRALFAKQDPQVYSNSTLCIPKDTAESKSAERTDGIVIVNPFFAISLYLPFDLYKPKKALSLYRYISLPARDQLIGCSIGKTYTYIILLETGVSTVRLLPRGFSDGSMMYNKTQIVVPSLAAGADDWCVLSELLTEMVAAGLPKTPVFQSLHKSFELFAEKDMAKASELLKEVHKMADQELCRVVQQFLSAIIDYSDAANKTDTELHAKRVLTARFHLFLKHMGLWDRIIVSPCTVMRGGVAQMRVGPTMLGEISERVAATSAIWTWKCSDESNAAIFDVIIEKALRIPEVQDLGLKDKDALFGRCGLVHHIPMIAAQQLDKEILTKAKAHRMEVFHSVCELLTGVRDAIFTWRNCRTRIPVPRLPLWWTAETFAPCYRLVAERILEELRDGQASDSERTRLFMYILGIYDFYLSEMDGRPDNDKILQDLIAMGKVGDAIELAERHKDFGTLIKNFLNTEIHTRQKTFERYKKTYENDDFEMYLCDYLKRNGRNDVLLQQGGRRVDAYLDNFKELRYGREIANKQFGKAALTLMSLAEAESKSFSKFSDFLTRAYYCASICQDGTDVSEVFDFYKRRYPEMKHRNRIPPEILKTGYGNDFDAMMSVEEMLEWNMSLQTSDEATVDGYARAFHLLADLFVVHPDSVELREKIEKTWLSVIDYDEWNRVKSKDDVEKKTMFGKFCDWLTSMYPADKGDPFPAWMPLSRLVILPSNVETLLEESTSETTVNQRAWIKGHIKWVAEQLGHQARLPKSAYFRPDPKENGSIGQAVLEGFAPILEQRELRVIAMLDKMSGGAKKA
ncbi:hypothetical protein B9Z55_011503 [Caenorhabditis nigoni]|uniref:Nucleoporin Nup133/Nup155-like N-terminal domain-containing protein n=1 Tax=Caenorhabditis nigoni TaxID=1611254 RepID=A0A2G5UKM9_9PELO|nr:hypothetical protein B9Z55_011503 [Caenorhabditis nigoni]